MISNNENEKGGVLIIKNPNMKWCQKKVVNFTPPEFEIIEIENVFKDEINLKSKLGESQKVVFNDTPRTITTKENLEKTNEINEAKGTTIEKHEIVINKRISLTVPSINLGFIANLNSKTLHPFAGITNPSATDVSSI